MKEKDSPTHSSVSKVSTPEVFYLSVKNLNNIFKFNPLKYLITLRFIQKDCRE